MADLSLQAESACAIPVPAADEWSAADWLRRFVAVGGNIVHDTAGKPLSIGWAFDDPAKALQARATFAEVEGCPERMAALRALPVALCEQIEAAARANPLPMALTASPAAPGGPDAAIEAAWQRRRAAVDHYDTMSPEDVAEFEGSDAYKAHWDLIAAAEEEIRSAIAITPAGVATQLWLALEGEAGPHQAEAVALRNRDLAHFEGAAGEFLGYGGFIVAALRSLAAMGEA